MPSIFSFSARSMPGMGSGSGKCLLLRGRWTIISCDCHVAFVHSQLERRREFIFYGDVTLLNGDVILDQKMKGQGHRERKCSNRFRAYHREKWVDLSNQHQMIVRSTYIVKYVSLREACNFCDICLF